MHVARDMQIMKKLVAAGNDTRIGSIINKLAEVCMCRMVTLNAHLMTLYPNGAQLPPT